MGLENRKKTGRLNGGSKMVVVGQGGFTQIKPVSQSSKGNIPQNDKFALNGGIPPCNLNEGKINLDFRIDNTKITEISFYSEIDPNYRKNAIFAVAYDPIDTAYKFKYFGINGETIDEPKLNQSPLESFALTSFSRINGNRFLISGNLTFENNYGMCVINQFGYIVNTIDFNITDYASQVKYIHSSVDKDGKFIIVGMSGSIEKCVYVYKTQGKVPSFYRQQIYRFNSNGEYDRTFKSVDSKQDTYDLNLFQPQSFSLNGVYVTNQNEYVVYGKFNSYSSKTSNNIIILDNNGFPKFNSFEDYTNNTVSDVVMDSDNNLYVVGSFNEYKGVPCKGIVKIPNVNTPVQEISFQNNLPSFLSGKLINSISIDSDGGLLITGNFDRRYCKLTNEGKLVESFGDTYTFTSIPTSLLKSMNKGYFLSSNGLKYIDDNQNIYQSIIKLKGC